MRVGWYVHHHGSGHLTRARTVGHALVSLGHDVTLLGSRLGSVSAPFAGLPLAMDTEGVDPHLDDPSAGGRLHWAPLRHSGFRDRMVQIAQWVQEWRPDVVVVDVSVEVGLLGRLLGVPVVVVAQPGDRGDEPHRAVYDMATLVLAPWPVGWSSRLAPHLADARSEVVEVGGISRLGPGREGATKGGVVLAGADGFDDPELVHRVTTAAHHLTWTVLDGRVWVDDLATVLAGAEVVVAHAGQNAVADLAAADRPALLLPQRRPFAEQDRLAEALASRGVAPMVSRSAQADPATDWGAKIAGAQGAPSRWEQWGTSGAAGRAAALVEEVARG